MIQANELRIGNWIYIDNGEKPKYPYQITAHDIEEIEGNGTDCFPIPLSSEVLESCGFESEPNQVFSNYYHLGKLRIDMDNHIGIFIEGSLLLHIYYLHQLQNIYFSLAASELPVNLQLKKA